NHIWLSFSQFWVDPNDPSHNPSKGWNRVWYGGFNGAGMDWGDYTRGLPVFPVNRLAYQEGSFGTLYAATDVGVYYRDSSMANWVCFNNNLPNVPVTDLEIN